MVEEEVAASVYGLISTWFVTPSYLFIFINLLIATIIITTRFANFKQQTPPTTTSLEEIETEIQNPLSHKPDPVADNQTRVRLARTPSLLERVMSGKFLRLQSIGVKRNEPEPGSDIGGSESGRGYLGGGEDEGVDEKADNFIKRFKEQLRMQRLDSILRYRDMIKEAN